MLCQWPLMWCSHERWGSWQMLLSGHSQHWLIMAMGRSAQKLEESNSYCQEQQEGGVRELTGWSAPLQSLGSWWRELFSLEEKRFRGILLMDVNNWKAGAKRREIDSCQCCPVTGQAAMGTNGNIGSFSWTSGNTFKRMAKHWQKLPRKVVKPLCLETFKSHLDIVLGDWF